MRSVKLYIASSLDGFITGPNEDIDWLFHDDDYGFSEFNNSIDTMIMGRKTYEKILSFGENLHDDKVFYVLSQKKGLKKTENTIIWQDGVKNLLSKIRNEPGKDIWLVGGGQITDLFLENHLIDEIILSIHPVILHNGTKLFPNKKLKYVNLSLVNTINFPSGLVQLYYSVCK